VAALSLLSFSLCHPMRAAGGWRAVSSGASASEREKRGRREERRAPWPVGSEAQPPPSLSRHLRPSAGCVLCAWIRRQALQLGGSNLRLPQHKNESQRQISEIPLVDLSLYKILPSPILHGVMHEKGGGVGGGAYIGLPQ